MIVIFVFSAYLNLQGMDEEGEKSEFNDFKQKAFNFTYELVSNEMNTKLFLLLTIIQNIQFLGYYNNGGIEFDIIGFPYFCYVTDYLNLLGFLQTYNINLILVPFFSVMMVVHIILLVIGYRAYQLRMEMMSKSISQRNFHKNKVEYFINLLVIGYTTIFTIPVFQTAVTAFYCTKDNPFTMHQQCYEGVHIFIAVLGVLNCLWLAMVNVYYAMYYYTRNPFSDSFMTCSSNWFHLGRFLAKIAPMIYFMYDPHFEFPVLFLIVINIAYSGTLLVFSRLVFGYYRYNFRLQKILTAIDFYVGLFNFLFVVVYVFQKPEDEASILMIAWAVMCLLLSMIVVEIIARMKRGLITEVNSIQKKKLPQTLEYLIYLINDTQAILREGKDKGKFYVASIAKAHRKQCDDPKCYCQYFFKAQKEPGYNSDKTVFYTLILAIVDRVIKRNKKAYPFFILKAYILFYKLQSGIKAATTISEVMSDKLDFSDDMLIKGLLFQLNEQYTDTRDMEVYRKFNQFLLKQEEESLALTNLYISYWDELIDQKSSIPKLHAIIHKIKRTKALVTEIVDGALSIFNNHVRVLLLYKSLLKEVISDYEGAIRCEERYRVGLKQNKLSNVDTVNKIQFRQNEDLLVVNLTRNYSSHDDSLGKYKIISISSNVRDFLGFSNSELKEQCINKLIPRIYHNIHDAFIDNQLSRKNSDIQSKQIRIFPLTSKGHIIQCNIISKFMPSLEHGITIVSFMEQCDKEKDQLIIIYNSSTGIVDSMTMQADLMLKDDSRRNNSTNSMLAIPDNIGDLVPNWDYRLQVWRDQNKYGKSIKTLPPDNEEGFEITNIQLFRTDGGDSKCIKILKVRVSSYDKMVSFDNDSIQESATIKQYLQHRRQPSATSQGDSAQLEGVIHFETALAITNPRERKMLTMHQARRQQRQGRLISIEESAGQRLRWCFIGVQMMLWLGGLVVTGVGADMLFIQLRSNIDDITVLRSNNWIQCELADSTALVLQIVTQLGYRQPIANLSMNYTAGNINVTARVAVAEHKFRQMEHLLQRSNDLLTDQMHQNRLSRADISLNARYQKTPASRSYYTKELTLIQSSYQHIAFGQEIFYSLLQPNQNIQSIVQSAPFYFILINNMQVVPPVFVAIQNKLMQWISSGIHHGSSSFIYAEIILGAIVLVAAVVTVLFYRHLLNDYILKVFDMYEQINVDKIRQYRNKCKAYKNTLTAKDDKEKSSESNIDMERAHSMDVVLEKEACSSLMEGQEEETKMLKPEQSEQQPQQHCLNFEEKPSLKTPIATLGSLFILYCVMVSVLAVTFTQQAEQTSQQANKLSLYIETQLSVVQTRLYTRFSLNLLNYWNTTEKSYINAELAKHLDSMRNLLDDTSLQYGHLRPLLAAKYHEMKIVQQMVKKGDKAGLNKQLVSILIALEQMQSFQNFFDQLHMQAQGKTEEASGQMESVLSVSIILSILFIGVFWILGVRQFYCAALEEHQITYQMYHIIGYNLRKEMEVTK